MKGATDNAGHSGKSRAEREDGDEQPLHPVSQNREHVAVIDAGTDHDADPGAIEREPHTDADQHRSSEDDQPNERIL